MTTLPSYGQVLTVRSEVFDPRGLLDMVDLGAVGATRKRRGLAERVPGSEVVRDPAAFFDLTYPTHEIVETLRTLSARSTRPESVPGTILLNGRYGLGKSHVLLAAHHALTSPDVVRAWAKRWSLPELDLPESAIVITRSFIQHADEPLWEMMLGVLGEGRKPKVGDFPDGERIESLLGDRPVFLVMDELERWYDAQGELAQSRNRNFLQALTEVSMRHPRLTVLTSVLGERPEPAETIRRVKPLELSFRSPEDRQRVVLFRLFSDRDGERASAAAAAAADAYATGYSHAGLRDVDAYRTRMLTTWPFTPEFLDILTKKVPNLGGFQNTRGTLRFLADVVRHTHKRRPVVSSQDLPIHEETVHQALANLDTSGGEVVRRALGDNYGAVPTTLKHKDELFSTIVFYSIADPTRPGATLDQILFATLDPGENPLQIRDSLAQLKQLAFNLHEQGERFVFMAVENPHARINAMAGSQLVTWDAVRMHILDAVNTCWGAPDQTAVYVPDDKAAVSHRLAELRGKRPRYIVSTATLTPAERLELQNLDERRNLVLLVEPTVRTGAKDARYRLLEDDSLVRHARRIEACKLLLEGRPAAEVGRVYREVQSAAVGQLQKAVSERFGTYIAWNRAGATGSPVDERWYEISRLDEFTASAFLKQVHQDHTSQPEITREVRDRWSDFRHRPVTSLIEHFDKTPGLPVPITDSMVPTAVRELAREGVLSLVASDGTPVPRARLEEINDAALGACTIANPRSVPTILPPEATPLPIHTQVQAHYDPTQRGVRLTWTYPRVSTESATLRTLVQRYTTARGWEEGRAYPMGTDQTHDANRYFGSEEFCLDTEHLQPGAFYHYYVFLVQDDPGGASAFVLSRRCDVQIPVATAEPEANLIPTTPQPDLGKLVVEVEKLLMSGKHMSAASRVRKIEVRLAGVTDPKLRAALAGSLGEQAGTALELTGDLMFVFRGEYDRQNVLKVLRAMPRLDGATYTVMLHLKASGSE